jgi:hypothetical protein
LSITHNFISGDIYLLKPQMHTANRQNING